MNNIFSSIFDLKSTKFVEIIPNTLTLISYPIFMWFTILIHSSGKSITYKTFLYLMGNPNDNQFRRVATDPSFPNICGLLLVNAKDCGVTLLQSYLFESPVTSYVSSHIYLTYDSLLWCHEIKRKTQGMAAYREYRRASTSFTSSK